MLLKLNDNKKTLIFAIACFFLVILLNLIQLKYIYASEPNLTELEKDFPNASTCINDNSNKYPYYIVYELDSDGIKRRYITFYDKVMNINMNPDYFPPGGFTPQFVLYNSEYDVNHQTYIYDFSSNSWVDCGCNTISKTATYNFALPWFSSSNYITTDRLKYTNFDIKTKNGTVVFQNARYQDSTIIGGITSKSIWTILLRTISGITVLVVGFLVSVIAFRKAWTMLKTVLVGA